jgi:galactokinase
MDRNKLCAQAHRKFLTHFGTPPTVAAYAPGRVEVLGNHTDYNDGFVLSAAINAGTCFLAAPLEGRVCHLVSGESMREVTFSAESPERDTSELWPNYVIGMLALLREAGAAGTAFRGLLLGDVPIGAGLSSSAALEISAGLALGQLYGIEPGPIELARMGQRAEHEYAGVRCGLLDQISSLYGQPDALVKTDFRSLEVQRVQLGSDACFLVINTNAPRLLVEGEYNQRRQQCERATAFFADLLQHPVTALRDVSSEELASHADAMHAVVAARAAHIIGENERVLESCRDLERGDLESFGRRMFASHESSRVNFQNSCPELDFLVDRCRSVPGVLGARLSGGGFGGSAVALVHPRDIDTVRHALEVAFSREFDHPCESIVIRPSQGAQLLDQCKG